jgi:hypothetical protein
MNTFTVAVQNQLGAALPHPNGGDFPGQPTVPIKENVKVVIT